MVLNGDPRDMYRTKGAFHAARFMFGDVVDPKIHSYAVRDSGSKERRFRGLVSTVGYVPLRVL